MIALSLREIILSKVSSDMRKEILVIGSANHSRATCAYWTDNFPNIEEFDIVIVNLPSLSQTMLDYLNSSEPLKLPMVRNQILTLFRTGRSVFCVYSEPIVPTPKSDIGQPKGIVETTARYPDSYEWLFFCPELTKVTPGRSLVLRDQAFERYFRDLSEWQYELQVSDSRLRTVPVAVNKSGKMIAAKVMIKGRGASSSGSIYLLPPLNPYSQQESIEVLIDIILGARKTAEYPWRERISIPELSELQGEITKHREAIGKINKEIEEVQKRYLDRESYRDLFSPDDQLQVKAVRRMLFDLGIQTDLTKPAFVIDLLGRDAAIEVTSESGMTTVKSSSVTQVARFIQQQRKQEKVILVANTYSRLPLEDRIGKGNFSREAKSFLEKLGACCVSAHCLYLLWKKAQEKSISPDNAKDKIFKKDGELTENEI